MISGYTLPDHLNPDFMRGYVEGYEACKVDVLRDVSRLEAVSTVTGTAEYKSEIVEHKLGVE